MDLVLACLGFATASRYLIGRLKLRYVELVFRPWLNLGDRFGPLFPAPRGLDFYALRRICGGACCLRACRAMGFAPAPADCAEYRRPVGKRFLLPLRTLPASGLR